MTAAMMDNEGITEALLGQCFRSRMVDNLVSFTDDVQRWNVHFLASRLQSIVESNVTAGETLEGRHENYKFKIALKLYNKTDNC